MDDNAARKYVALGSIEEIQGKHAAALSDTDKALAKSQSAPIEFLAARTYVDAGDLAKAHKLAASLSSSLTNESQAYGEIIEGMIALKKKNNNDAIRLIARGEQPAGYLDRPLRTGAGLSGSGSVYGG